MTRSHHRNGRRGFSLLEMVLALTILGASLAILAQIADTGSDAAREARALVSCRMICQTKLNEELLNITYGQSPAIVVDAPVEAFDSQSTETYLYSLEIANGQLDGLLALRATVRAMGGDGSEAIASFALDRWVIDPLVGLEEAEAEEEAAREELSGEAAPS
ncbi:MAG: type II secretion system protein [Planctomycetota bacterium]